ncbi:hypothetical protein [Streptomyces sp. NPDC051183]|uniref:hypothetical protein n=1 Tax=Streptomyces sp. NPDC051183 TaxID=3155165 RepID=UPI003422E660
MISEPELEGEWPRAAPESPAGPAQEPAAAGGSVRGPARPWLWALGGAVLASAVWAGAWTLEDRFADAGPPIAYRHSQDLCADAKMQALGKLVGGFDGGGIPHHAETPAVDWSYCSYAMRWGEDRLNYQVQTAVEAHRKTDPEPEFGTGPGFDPDLRMRIATSELVPGLGERALIAEYAGACRIDVLDGGVVLSVVVQWFGQEGQPEPDGDALKAALIEDARELMAALRK